MINLILFLLEIQSRLHNKQRIMETIDRKELISILNNDIYCEGYGLYAIVKMYKQNCRKSKYVIENGMIYVQEGD